MSADEWEEQEYREEKETLLLETKVDEDSGEDAHQDSPTTGTPFPVTDKRRVKG